MNFPITFRRSSVDSDHHIKERAMKTTLLGRWGLLLLLLGLFSSGHAEDTDIYSDKPRTGDVPNVLLVLDNAANFSASAGSCTYVDKTAPSLNGTAGGIEQCALYNVVSGLPDGAINIGVMVFNDNNMRDINGANCGGANGGCLAVPLTLMTGTDKTKFLSWVKSWRTSGGAGSGYIKASGTATAATMQESWAYYAGQTGLSGRNYASIQPAAGCQKNFVIYIGNAFNNSGTPGDGGSSSPLAALKAAPSVTSSHLSPITIPSGYYGTTAFSCGYYSMPSHTDSSGLYTDEWARYMKDIDLYGDLTEKQSIVSYTIGLMGPSCKPDYPALLNSTAINGGGKYFATSSYEEIVTAILKILNEVQAVNSVFASASLPVSVNAQGTFLNQIYLGMFRPDASGNPRWLGNLKQYQFILQYNDPTNPDPNNATLQLGDSLGNLALSAAGTGFIDPSAVSFWTKKDTSKAPDSTGGFFSNDVRGVGAGYDSPDGELVEKGGVAQHIRLDNLTVNYANTPSSPRRLYTYCPSGTGCNTSLTDVSNQFATTNNGITDAMLSAVNSVAVTSLVRSATMAIVTTGVKHGFATGDTVTISGANQSEYNGDKALINVLTDYAFSFEVAENPPALASGSYTASVPGSPQVIAAGNLTRSGGTVTANLPGHGFVTGQSVTIAGATEARYNGTHTVTVLDGTTFRYTIVEGPISPAGSGTAKVGNSSRTIEAFNASPSAGIQRATGSTLVTVTTTNNHQFSAGNTVTISGVLDALGNLIPQYNITADIVSVPSNRSFTYRIVATTPESPATSTSTITADGTTSPKPITELKRVGTTAIATVANHGYANGQTVSLGIVTLGVNENAYVGSWTISDVMANTFNFGPVTLTPASPATGTIVVSKAGVSDRTSLINWVRGENNFGDEPNPGFGYTVRQSVHGDVLHSRPLVINYGDSRGMVVFYGANDGVFRAVNGSQTAAIGSVAAGGELWGLILPEHYLKLNRQRVNDPALKLPTTLLPSAQTKDYFVDGPTGSYQQLNADGTIAKAYVYLTMRRGGRFMYALDVTNPVSPRVVWRLSSSQTGFAELGQTWSRPRLTLLKGYLDGAGKAKPVLVFGAGYDAANEDAEPPTADVMGRGIFVVDAETGDLIWRATSSADTSSCPSTAACVSVSGMNWAIPADISFVDRDNDGLIDRFYAADLGGNVWRVDTETSTTPSTNLWQVSRLAALGCATGACASGTTPRKFFFPPNVVPVGATGGVTSYDAVLLGSGDREHPLISTDPNSAYLVTNRFYMLKDTRTGKDANAPAAWATLTEANLFNATTASFPGTGSGYYVNFATGEKAVNASITTRGTTYFGTNTPVVPAANSCTSSLGLAKGYSLSPFTAGYGSTVYDGGGMPPSPVAGVVGLVLPNGQTMQQPFCIGCGGSTSLTPVDPSKKVPKKPRRNYWYKR